MYSPPLLSGRFGCCDVVSDGVVVGADNVGEVFLEKNHLAARHNTTKSSKLASADFLTKKKTIVYGLSRDWATRVFEMLQLWPLTALA